MNNKQLYEKIMRNVSKEVKRALNESTDYMSFVENNIPPLELLDITKDFILKILSIYSTLDKNILDDDGGVLPMISIVKSKTEGEECYAYISMNELNKIANIISLSNEYKVRLDVYQHSNVDRGDKTYLYYDLLEAVADIMEDFLNDREYFDFTSEWIEFGVYVKNNQTLIKTLSRFANIYKKFVTTINNNIDDYLPEVEDNTPVYVLSDGDAEYEVTLPNSASIDIDAIAILTTSYSWRDIFEADDKKRVRSEWRKVSNYVKANIVNLENKGIKAGVHREIIEFSGINENNVLNLVEFIIETLGQVNEVYIDDLRACIDISQIEEYFEEKNPKMAKNLEKMLHDWVSF